MDSEERKYYMAEYNSAYRSGKRETAYLEDRYLVNKHANSQLAIKPTQMNFTGSDRDEPRFCRVFGCGKQLSLEELRFGNKCINHQQTKKNI